MKKLIACFFLLSGCIGTDVLDDAFRDPILTINDEDGVIQLLTGQSAQITVTYLNEYGVEDDTTPIWMSSNIAVASVDAGSITANGAGQATITAEIGETAATILVNVSETSNDVNKVEITTEIGTLSVGQSVQLDATLWTVDDMEITGKEVTWSIDNPSVATVSESGLLNAISNGEARVTAEANGVQSLPKVVQVGGESRTGSFQGSSGYLATGKALLYKNKSGDIILELSDDFETDFALGTFIYLSNSTSGSNTRNAGLELGEITSNGAVSFNVSEALPGITLNTYDYVVVLCKPASITFGFAELN